jgi:flagellar protein FliO/FliZ
MATDRPPLGILDAASARIAIPLALWMPAAPAWASGVAIDRLGAVALGTVLVGMTVLALLRYLRPAGGNGDAARHAVRIIGSRGIGPRERLLLVEVDSVRILIGVSAGQIRALHVFADAAGVSRAMASAPAGMQAERLR